MNTEVHTLSRPSGCQEVCRHFVISARRRGDSSSVCWVVLVRACSSSLVRGIIGAADVLLHVCAQDLVCPSVVFCEDRSIPMVKLRHRLLQKKCSKVMVSQLLSYGEDSDRHDVYPKPDLNGNFLGYGFPLCDQTGFFLVGKSCFRIREFC